MSEYGFQNVGGISKKALYLANLFDTANGSENDGIIKASIWNKYAADNNLKQTSEDFVSEDWAAKQIDLVIKSQQSSVQTTKNDEIHPVKQSIEVLIEPYEGDGEGGKSDFKEMEAQATENRKAQEAEKWAQDQIKSYNEYAYYPLKKEDEAYLLSIASMNKYSLNIEKRKLLSAVSDSKITQEKKSTTEQKIRILYQLEDARAIEAIKSEFGKDRLEELTVNASQNTNYKIYIDKVSEKINDYVQNKRKKDPDYKNMFPKCRKSYIVMEDKESKEKRTIKIYNEIEDSNDFAIEAFKSLNPKVYKDIFTELTSINLANATFTSSDGVYDANGFFHPERNSISINDKNIEQDPGDKSYVKWTPSGERDFDNALYKNIVKSAYIATITHEVGHAVDYSRNLQSASSGYLTTTDKNLKKELANFLKVLSESESKYNSENTYALKNSLELFAEYYTYTYASDPLTSKGFFPYLESKKCPKILREAWQKLKVQFDEIIANNNK